jgi:hypothetical protein
MSKDALFFGHDSNAKDDPKIIQLIEEMGLEGYGIYWVLLELMRDQPDYKYKLCLVPAIARRYNTTFEKVKNVISKYGLFVIDADEFWSNAFINRMSNWDEKKKKRSEAGKKGNEARWGNKSQCDNLAITDGIVNESNAIAIKEKKEKEIKENKKKEKEIKENKFEQSEEKSEKPKKPKKEKPIKHNYAEFVLLSSDEHQKLIDQFGESGTARIIEILNLYKGANGKTYKSDYMAIFSWVVERYQKENPSNKNNQGNVKKDNTIDYLQRMYLQAKAKEAKNNGGE